MRFFQYSELAQLAEHLTVNQVVAGSSPAFGAKTKRPSFDGLFVLLFKCSLSPALVPPLVPLHVNPQSSYFALRNPYVA